MLRKGDHEFKGKRPLSGGHLSIAITHGTHRLRLKGSTTSKQGIASAAFTVPHVAKGTVLHAVTTVVYEGHLYRGSNQVKVTH